MSYAHPRGYVFVLSGPSGAGKTTLYERLLKSPKLKKKLAKTVSWTTRTPRKGERNGRDYYFISKRMFDYKRRAGHFLESMKVFDNYYGTSAKQVKEMLKQGKHVLLCIDVQGAKVVCRKIPDAVSIFVKTADLKELRRRLTSRATDKAQTIALRLQTAKQELACEKDYQYVLVNDNLNACYRTLENLILSRIS